MTDDQPAATGRLRNPPEQQSALAHCPCHATLAQSECA